MLSRLCADLLAQPPQQAVNTLHASQHTLSECMWPASSTVGVDALDLLQSYRHN